MMGIYDPRSSVSPFYSEGTRSGLLEKISFYFEGAEKFLWSWIEWDLMLTMNIVVRHF